MSEAQARLPELIARLRPGDEVQITRDDEPVARLFAEPRRRSPRRPGSAVGKLVILSDDDEHLEDYRDYLP
jgi:antitoxin (DNA-binding transcriptional repressor) of toxin-antitoxin stability system